MAVDVVSGKGPLKPRARRVDVGILRARAHARRRDPVLVLGSGADGSSEHVLRLLSELAVECVSARTDDGELPPAESARIAVLVAAGRFAGGATDPADVQAELEWVRRADAHGTPILRDRARSAGARIGARR